MVLTFGLCSFNLALAFFVPPGYTNITWRLYMIFGTFCAVMTIHVFLMFPETARKSLEEMDYIFDNNIPAWRSKHAGLSLEDRVAEAKAVGSMKENDAVDEQHEEKQAYGV